MSFLQAASTKIGDPFTKHGGSRSSSEMPKVPAPNDQWSDKNQEVDSKFLLGSFSSQNFQSSERMQKKLQEHIDEFTQGKARQS